MLYLTSQDLFKSQKLSWLDTRSLNLLVVSHWQFGVLRYQGNRELTNKKKHVLIKHTCVLWDSLMSNQCQCSSSCPGSRARPSEQSSPSTNREYTSLPSPGPSTPCMANNLWISMFFITVFSVSPNKVYL